MIEEVEKRGLDFGWDRSHCPAVFTGPDTAGAHYQPTDRKVERGHVLNMDFGVKFEELHVGPPEDVLHAGGGRDTGPAGGQERIRHDRRPQSRWPGRP